MQDDKTVQIPLPPVAPAEPPSRAADELPGPLVYSFSRETKDLLQQRFAEYLTPDFTQRLVQHMREAKKAALLETQE